MALLLGLIGLALSVVCVEVAKWLTLSERAGISCTLLRVEVDVRVRIVGCGGIPKSFLNGESRER